MLTGLALGSYAAVVLLRRRTAATSGYLAFTTACAIGFGVLAWLSDGALPATLGGVPGRRSTPPGTARASSALVAFCALAVIGAGRPPAPARAPAR